MKCQQLTEWDIPIETILTNLSWFWFNYSNNYIDLVLLWLLKVIAVCISYKQEFMRYIQIFNIIKFLFSKYLNWSQRICITDFFSFCGSHQHPFVYLRICNFRKYLNDIVCKTISGVFVYKTFFCLFNTIYILNILINKQL